MNRQYYTDIFLEHYETPRNHGALPEADVVEAGTNPGCGDEITIYLKVGPGDIAETIQFEGEGCTISLGAASILLDMVQGKPLAEILAMDYNDLIDALGREVVLTRVGCATLSLSTLKQAIRQYHVQQIQSASNGRLEIGD